MTARKPAPWHAPGGPRGAYAKGRAKRQQIIDAAIEVFADIGFNGASLRYIASRAGISHPGLLHHFPTKSALLEAVLQDRDRVDADAFDAELARGVRFFDALLHVAERNEARRPIVELFAVVAAEATSADHPAHEYFVRRYESVVAALHSELQVAATSGRLRLGLNPMQAARSIVALMDGLQVQWLLSLSDPTRGRVDMAAHLRAHLRLVLAS